MTDNVFVYITDLPPSIHEMVAPCDDGYSVYINAKLSQMGMIHAYQHALSHIDGCDWEKHDVQEIEKERHGV